MVNRLSRYYSLLIMKFISTLRLREKLRSFLKFNQKENYMKLEAREFNKEKSQQDMDKLFKQLNGYENPYAIKIVKDNYKKK